MGLSLYLILLLVIFNVGFVLGACWINGKVPKPERRYREREIGNREDENLKVVTGIAR